MVRGTKKNSNDKSRRFRDIKEGDCIFPFIYEGKLFDGCIPDTIKKNIMGHDVQLK